MLTYAHRGTITQYGEVITLLDAQDTQVTSLATGDEVLLFLTCVLRGAFDGDPSVKERMRAAELLGKSLGCFDGEPDAPRRAVIIDDLGDR